MNIQFQFKRVGLLASLLLPVSLAYASPCDLIVTGYAFQVGLGNFSAASSAPMTTGPTLKGMAIASM